MTFKNTTQAIQMEFFNVSEQPTAMTDFATPKTYTGLAGFHKYWGKKPIESVTYLIENCTDEGDIVLDPFLGSGLISRECLLRKRKFIGIDINPFSFEYTSFLLRLPTRREYIRALLEIENSVAEKINNTYLTSGNLIASHYLWEKDKLVSVWIKPETGRSRIEIEPSEFDRISSLAFKNYIPKNFRDFIFFTNSRINVNPSLTSRDILTGRAICNIDLLIESIVKYPPHLKRALLLTLTSSAGQMSNMVFAIKNRKSNGTRNKNKENIEVGSWVIGYWLPETHFEINVWNCFKNRANKLLKVLPAELENNFNFSTDFSTIRDSKFNAWIINSDCRKALRELPSECVAFVCTDPPHSDRIPYLELSELWNSLLGYTVDFEREIVVSNAKERKKTKHKYNSEMSEFFIETSRILKPDGYIALFYNARDEESWQYIKSIETTTPLLKFVGCFPMEYTATSVVQDNRKNSMKNDYVIIYQKQVANTEHYLSEAFTRLPGWSSHLPN